MRNSMSLSEGVVRDLLNSGAEYVVRFKMPKDVVVRFTDLVRGTVVFNTDTLDDKVLFKSTKIPTYHLANVCDDHNMDITHVFRGEEWLPSTPLHLLLYDALGWKSPEFAHLPLILDKNGKKLSKRNAIEAGYPIFPFSVDVKDGDNALGRSEGFKELGFDPIALKNYLCLLGWHPKDDREIMTEKEMIELFDISDVNSSGAKFDMAKAEHFNRLYLSMRSDDELMTHLPDNVFGYTEEGLKKIARAATERASFEKDIATVVDYFFTDVELPIDSMKRVDEFPPFLSLVIEKLEKSEWKPGNLFEDILSLIGDAEIHRGSALNNLRLCITGGASGPKMHEMMEMMGKNEFLRRLKKAELKLKTTCC